MPNNKKVKKAKINKKEKENNKINKQNQKMLIKENKRKKRIKNKNNKKLIKSKIRSKTKNKTQKTIYLVMMTKLNLLQKYRKKLNLKNKQKRNQLPNQL